MHKRFGEELVYYLLRVRPFHNEIKNQLRTLLESKNLESVRIFEIFGRNDLLVRAWLHPVAKRDFPGWVRETLASDIELEEFTVTEPFRILSGPPSLNLPDSDLLNNLFNEDIIKAVQDGHDEILLKQLVEAGIVFSREQVGPDPIKFFLSIRLPQEARGIKDAYSWDLFEHISSDMKTIENVSIYQGVGFCHLLLKGDVVGNFFAIGELIDWILDNLSEFKASTETYVVALPTPLVETADRISKATFQAIRGMDPFVNNIIPELYEKYYSNKVEIERLFSEVSKPTVMEAKKLVHAYLLGYLKQKNADVKIVLFTLFNELEEFLRLNHIPFAVKNGLQVGDVYRVIHYKDHAKQITLGTLFDFYYHVAELKGETHDMKWAGSLKELSHLRNKPFHGDWDFHREWDTSLKLILKSWPGIKKLIEIIKKTNETVEYEFTYLPFCGPTNGRPEHDL
ncbi:MAG TPA: hypothetical protein VNO50_07495 [Pyrinomonadaceae bacterium]|nr:hypothetical protein [Pyrinomonadaceae bacterium]